LSGDGYLAVEGAAGAGFLNTQSDMAARFNVSALSKHELTVRLCTRRKVVIPGVCPTRHVNLKSVGLNAHLCHRRRGYRESSGYMRDRHGFACGNGNILIGSLLPAWDMNSELLLDGDRYLSLLIICI